jgi:hypothetical protein
MRLLFAHTAYAEIAGRSFDRSSEPSCALAWVQQSYLNSKQPIMGSELSD